MKSTPFLHKFLSIIFSIKQEEWLSSIFSFLFIFLLFASYAILRPIREALGVEVGEDEIKWLFLATFISCIFASLASMYLSTKIKRKHYINGIFIFFALNALCFVVVLNFLQDGTQNFFWFGRIFYVWLSVFNMFVISSAWSLLSDLFTKDSSKRLFGIIMSAASFGSIVGAFLVSFLTESSKISITSLFLISTIFLLTSISFKYLLIKQSFKLLKNNDERYKFDKKFNTSIGSKNPFEGFKLIINSKHLLTLLFFILLSTSASTFLYMEQLRIVEEFFKSREERIQVFANIDLAVQILSFLIQIFLTAKIAQFFGIKYLLSLLGFVLGFGFLLLSFFYPSFLLFVIIMVIRRVAEYSLVKPGREMLFVPLDSDSKYKVKNFLDTVVYRGGDALSSQLESYLTTLSIQASLFGGALLSFIWGYLGRMLAKNYEDTR